MQDKNRDEISEIMNDGSRVRNIIQKGITNALLMHKHAGNPVCEWVNDEVVWIQADKILTSNDEEI